MRKLLKSLSNVAASVTASVTTPELDGYAIFGFDFVLGGGAMTKALMTRIQLDIAGTNIIDRITGTQLENMNNFKLYRTQGANDLSLFLGNPEAPDHYAQHYSDFDLGAIKDPQSGQAASVALQVDIGAATTPTLVVYGNVERPKLQRGFSAGDSKVIKKYLRTLINLSAAQTLYPYDVNIGTAKKGGLLYEWWLHTNLTSLQIFRNNEKIWDNIAIQEMNAWALDQLHPATSGQYVYTSVNEHNAERFTPPVLGIDARAGQSKLSLATYQHLLTTSAADTITVFAEVVGQYADLY